jgi:hypothetical protein
MIGDGQDATLCFSKGGRLILGISSSSVCGEAMPFFLVAQLPDFLSKSWTDPEPLDATNQRLSRSDVPKFAFLNVETFRG